MSGFNTKEVNNNGEYEITFYTENREDFKKVQSLCRELIGNDTPVSTETDLISRSALKDRAKTMLKIIGEDNLSDYEQGKKYAFETAIDFIDNAPTVDIWQMRQEATENALKKAEVLYGRPQGEWIKWNFKTFGAMGDWEYKCSNCEKVYGGEYNFCPNCGARMQKGGAE